MTNRSDPLRSFRVRLTTAAQRDVLRINDYLSRSSSPQQAAVLVAELIASVESLASLPLRHRAYRASPRPGRVMRMLPCGSYVIYYRVHARTTEVIILTLRHGARRPPTRFPAR